MMIGTWRATSTPTPQGTFATNRGYNCDKPQADDLHNSLLFVCVLYLDILSTVALLPYHLLTSLPTRNLASPKSLAITKFLKRPASIGKRHSPNQR